jgi:glycogen debranching enzyme
LKIAYDLDEGILQFSREFDSLYGFDPHIKDEAELEMVMRVFLLDHIPKLALWEYFVINVGSHVAKLEERIKTLITGRRPSKEDSDGIKRSTNINSLADALANDGNHDRFSEYLVLDRVVEFYDQEINGIVKAASESDRSLRLSSLLSSYRTSIDAINYRKYRCYDEKIQKIMANLRSRIRYERLDHNGPRLGPVSEKYQQFLRMLNNCLRSLDPH